MAAKSNRSKSPLIAPVFLALLINILVPFRAAASSPEEIVTVFAASSLSRAFDQIGSLFEEEHPRIHLRFSYLASSALASQLTEGAPADVFASASIQDMSSVRRLISKPQPFATNRIVLAFPKQNKNLVSKFSDLNKSSVKWLQCAVSVPCGAITTFALNSLGIVRTKPVSYESKVTSAVSKLIAKEVDAAFIYHSDFIANKGVLRELRFPTYIDTSTSYEIALIGTGNHKVASRSFVQLVFSGRGQKILSVAGFELSK